MSDVPGSPNPAVLEAMRNAEASSKQASGGGMSSDDIFQSIQQKGTKGFDNTITKGASGNLVDDLGSSPLTAAVGGKSPGEAFGGLQKTQLAPAISGDLNTAKTVGIGHNAVGSHKGVGVGG